MSIPNAQDGDRRLPARRTTAPNLRLLDLVLIVGAAAAVVGYATDRLIVTMAGAMSLGLAGASAVGAARRLLREREPERRRGRDRARGRESERERAHRTAAATGSSDAAGRAAPAREAHRTGPEAADAAAAAAAGSTAGSAASVAATNAAGTGPAISALASQLLAAAHGDPRRERALHETFERFAAGHGGETAAHTARVGEMARELALLAGLPPAEADLLREAAPLHDLGQAAIPAAILDKPGRLSAREFALMKKHTILGHRILSRSRRPALQAAATIALQHHERWDGMGYPQRLQGEEIHLHARIVGLVDAFDAMFRRRTYRQELTLEQALGIIRTQRDHHFDPRLHDLFTENLQRFLDIIERHPEPLAPEAPARKAALTAEDTTTAKPATARARRRVPVAAGAGRVSTRRER